MAYDRHLAFASEIKAFMAHPDFKVRVNQAALREYFTFQNLFRPHTLFDGVEQLPAATILTIRRRRRATRNILGLRFFPTRADRSRRGGYKP